MYISINNYNNVNDLIYHSISTIKVLSTSLFFSHAVSGFRSFFPNVSPALNTDIWIVLYHPGYLVFEGEIFSPTDINPS